MALTQQGAKPAKYGQKPPVGGKSPALGIPTKTQLFFLGQKELGRDLKFSEQSPASAFQLWHPFGMGHARSKFYLLGQGFIPRGNLGTGTDSPDQSPKLGGVQKHLDKAPRNMMGFLGCPVRARSCTQLSLQVPSNSEYSEILSMHNSYQAQTSCTRSITCYNTG